MLQVKELTDYKGKFLKDGDGNYLYVMTKEVREVREQLSEDEADLKDLESNG